MKFYKVRWNRRVQMRGGLKGGPGRILGVQVGEELIDIIEELNKEIVHNNNNRNLNTTHIIIDKLKHQISKITKPPKKKDSKSHYHNPKTTPKTNKKLTILFQIVSKIQ